jgi:hypothetical protein
MLDVVAIVLVAMVVNVVLLVVPTADELVCESVLGITGNELVCEGAPEIVGTEAATPELLGCVAVEPIPECVPDPTGSDTVRNDEGVGLLLSPVASTVLLDMVTVGDPVEDVTDPLGISVVELGVVAAACELGLAGSNVMPGLTVKVEDGNMLNTGMVDASPGPVLLSIKVNDRKMDVDEVVA